MELMNYSSTVSRKAKYDDMLDITKFNLKLGIPPEWEFKLLNARTGKENDKVTNKRHYTKKRTFVINILA